MPIDQDTGRTLGAPEPLGLPAFWTGSFSSSADARTLAFVSAEPRSTVYTAAFDSIRGSVTGYPHQVMTRTGNMGYLDGSPDGAWLVLNDQYRNEEIFLIRPDGSGYRQLLADPFRNGNLASHRTARGLRSIRIGEATTVRGPYGPMAATSSAFRRQPCLESSTRPGRPTDAAWRSRTASPRSSSSISKGRCRSPDRDAAVLRAAAREF